MAFSVRRDASASAESTWSSTTRTLRRHRSLTGFARGFTRSGRVVQERQRISNWTCGPACPRDDRAAVQLDERLHEREADPEAGLRRILGGRPWVNRSNTRGRRSALMPTPVSRTRRTAAPRLRHLNGDPAPSSVNLRALPRRLRGSVSSRAGSACTDRGEERCTDSFGRASTSAQGLRDAPASETRSTASRGARSSGGDSRRREGRRRGLRSRTCLRMTSCAPVRIASAGPSRSRTGPRWNRARGCGAGQHREKFVLPPVGLPPGLPLWRPRRP